MVVSNLLIFIAPLFEGGDQILVLIDLLWALQLVLLSLVASQKLPQALFEASVDADTASAPQHPIDCEIAPLSPAAYWA